MTIRTALALGTILSAAVASAPAPAAAVRCDQLHGHTRVSDRRIRVVEQRVRSRRFHGVVVRGCARPRGRVFTLGRSGEPQRGDVDLVDTSIGAHAAVFVEVRTTQGDGLAQAYDERRWIVNLVSGTRREFLDATENTGECEDQRGFFDGSTRTPPVRRVVLRPTGLFAVLYEGRADDRSGCWAMPGEALLLGFPLTGDPVHLDRQPHGAIPRDSIAVSGTVHHYRFSWTSAGQPRTYPTDMAPAAR